MTKEEEMMAQDLKKRCAFMTEMLNSVYSDDAEKAISDDESLGWFKYFRDGTKDMIAFLNRMYDATMGVR